MKFSTYYFHMKTKILVDFQICISVPLNDDCISKKIKDVYQVRQVHVKNCELRWFRISLKKLYVRLNVKSWLIFQLEFSFKSSHQRCSVKKGVLRNLSKFKAKYLFQSLFFNKVAGLRPKACNFIEKKTLVQVFSCEFSKIS